MSLSDRIRIYSEVLRFTPFDASTEHGRSRERYRLIAFSGISGLAAKMIIALSGLVSVPLTVHYLGKEQFGLWMVVSSLVVWMQLADFGIGNGLTNAVAEAYGRDDQNTASGLIATAFVAASGIAVFGLLTVYLLSLWLPWDVVLNLPRGELVHLASRCFFAAGVVFVVNIPFSLAGRVLIAYQRGYIANIVQIVSALVALVGLLTAIWLEFDIVWLVWFISSGPLVGNLLAWSILLKVLPWLRFRRKNITGRGMQRISKSSVPLFLFQIGALLVNQLVNIVIALVGSLKMVADYNITLKIYVFIFAVGISLSTPFYPAIREAYEKHEVNWAFKALKRVLFVRLGVLLPAGICLLFIGDEIIRIWIREPLESRFGFMGWFVFLSSLLFAAVSSTLSEVLISLDDIWAQIKMVFISAAVVILSMYIMIPHIGVTGVYLAMALSTLYAILWSWRRLKVKLQENYLC